MTIREMTTDDLDELPEDQVRRELIDGVLVVTPSPTNVHQTVAAKLAVALELDCPAEFDVRQGVEVRVSKKRTFIPDVLVTTAEAAKRSPRRFAPEEVILVVEIVSPSTRTFDRVTKPALYAEAGIPHYWRIETHGRIEVFTYALTNGAYESTGSFADTVDLAEPDDHASIPLAHDCRGEIGSGGRYARCTGIDPAITGEPPEERPQVG